MCREHFLFDLWLPGDKVISQWEHLAWKVGIVVLRSHSWLFCFSFPLAACIAPSNTVNAAGGVGASSLVPVWVICVFCTEGVMSSAIGPYYIILACDQSNDNSLHYFGSSWEVPGPRKRAHTWHWDICLKTYGFWKEHYPSMQDASILT